MMTSKSAWLYLAGVLHERATDPQETLAGCEALAAIAEDLGMTREAEATRALVTALRTSNAAQTDFLALLNDEPKPAAPKSPFYVDDSAPGQRSYSSH